MFDAQDPPMLIGTRFGIGIRDTAWFEHRLEIFAAVTAPSLLAQTDQAFRWALFVDAYLPVTVRDRLEAILAPFEGRAFLCVDPRRAPGDIYALGQRLDLVDDRGYLLTAGIDDDDAWHVGTVRDVRKRVGAWSRRSQRSVGLGLTFKDGLEWAMYDMLDVEQLQSAGLERIKAAGIYPFSFAFLSMSMFIYSRSQNLTAISMGHSQSVPELKRHHHEIQSVATPDPMWLYCRHKQTDSETGTHRDSPTTQIGHSLSFLAERFGIDKANTGKYLAEAARHDYCVTKGTVDKRIVLTRKLENIEDRLGDSPASEEETKLMQDHRRLRAEFAQISTHVLGSPT